jgi:hypothetical protein
MTDRPDSWTIDGLTYYESAVEEYAANSCYISAGLVVGHAVDSVYIRLEKNDNPDEEVFVILRPDELAALVSVAGRALQDHLLCVSAEATQQEPHD